MHLLCRSRFAAILLLAVLTAACSSSDKKPDDAPAIDAGPGYPYEVTIEGAPDEEFEDLLRSALRVFTLAERLPASESRLRRRIEGDLDFVEKAFRSEGYLKGSVTYDIVLPDEALPLSPDGADPAAEASSVSFSGVDEPGAEEQRVEKPDDQEQKTGKEPLARVVIYLEPGERFKFAGLTFAPARIAGGPEFPSLESLGFVVGEPARAAVVVEAEAKLVRWLQDQGRPRARFVKREVSASSDTLEMMVVTTIDPGPAFTMDAPTFAGSETVDQAYLESYVNWEPGRRASRTVLETYQQRLYGTGLFESVIVALPESEESEADASSSDGQMPVLVTTSDALARTAGAGLSYSTVDGFGVNGLLEHRNLFGANETIKLEAELAVEAQRAGLIFEKPQFLAHDQRFRASVIALHEDFDAYTIRALRGFTGLERRFSRRLTASADIGAEYADVTDVPIPGISRLVLLPLTADYDRSDDKLDPTKGFRLNAVVTPAGGTFRDDPLYFTTVDLRGSTYWAIGDDGTPDVLALRGRLGSLLGASRDSVPAHRRLFSGGGGSIRAYDRYFVGPIDADGDPLGGRSVAELSFEYRIRFGESLGVVPFIEAGSVSEAEFPDFDDGVQAGYGLGLRYYTPIGPMRADVAFPIDGREVDKAFQFYISIGQAF